MFIVAVITHTMGANHVVAQSAGKVECPESCHELMETIRTEYNRKIKGLRQELESTCQYELSQTENRFRRKLRALDDSIAAIELNNMKTGSSALNLDIRDTMNLAVSSEDNKKPFSNLEALFVASLAIVVKVLKVCLDRVDSQAVDNEIVDS